MCKSNQIKLNSFRVRFILKNVDELPRYFYFNITQLVKKIDDNKKWKNETKMQNNHYWIALS